MQDNKDKIREKNIDNISKHIADTKIKNKIKKIDKIKRGLIIKKYSKDFFYIIVGCFIMAMGTSLFLLPNQLSSGGFAGISTIIYYLFKLPLGITMFFLNIPLLILAFFKVSKELFFKSIIGTLLLTLFIDLLHTFQAFTDDKLLACIYGGILNGIGTALVLRATASTGGTDLLTYVIRKYKPHFQTATLIVVVDTIIVLLNVVFFKRIEVGLYSAIAIYLMGKMIDIVFEGVNFTKMMFIISNEYKEIATRVGKELDRGSTAIYAKGMYTREKRMMLLCVGTRTEIAKIKMLAIEIDPKAFIITANARETWGKGFKKVK